MAQGYTGYNIIDNEITIKDSANLDAFSRLRVSNPLTIFNNQFTYDLSPLVFEQYASDQTTCYATHDSTNRLAVIEFNNNLGVGDYIYMQSYEYIPYQPGRSQLVFITFNMFPSGTITNDSLRSAGLSDGVDGFEFQYDGGFTGMALTIYTSTGAGNQLVQQPSWNLDRLDGTGSSGVTLDLIKTQILVIDFQALYVGRVRMGFDIDGTIIYAHEFLNCNSSLTFPYIATANLPVRVGMTALTTSLTEQMHFICCAVASEGGVEDAERFGYVFSVSTPLITAVNTYTHIMSIRPKTTFAGYPNRTKFVLTGIEVLNTGNRPAQWYLGIGATLASATYTDANANYSAAEYDYSGAFTTSPQVIIDSGYAPSGGGSRSDIGGSVISSKYPITLDAAGNQRDYGTLSIAAEGLGGATDLYFTLKWKETR
jgi:hypothetical protein